MGKARAGKAQTCLESRVMKQEAAQSIIEEANQYQHITASLDDSYIKCARNGGGYRVRLVHKRARRVLSIEHEEQWESVLQAWQDL